MAAVNSDTNSTSSESSSLSDGDSFYITFNLREWDDEPEVAEDELSDRANSIRSQLSEVLDLFRVVSERLIQEAQDRELNSLIVHPDADPEWAQRQIEMADAWAAAEVAAEDEQRAEAAAANGAGCSGGQEVVIAPTGFLGGPADELDLDSLEFVPGELDAESQRELDDYLEEYNKEDDESS